MHEEIENLLKAGRRNEAIYQLRQWYICSYEDARTYVNTVALELNLLHLIW